MLTLLVAPLFKLFLATAPAPTPAQLVVPGRSIGSLRLGTDPAVSLPPLGPPAVTDGAMLKAWATWYGQGKPASQLDVYTAPPPGDDGSHKSVQVVRATSTFFRLTNGLRNGSTLTQIKAVYGRLPLAITYRLAVGTRYLYDDVAHGIAFETDGTTAGSHCRALIVHLPGRAVAQTNLPLASYLKELPVRR
jgi:hypothetical protein